MNRTLDLRARGEKTILVKVEGSELDRDKELDYLEVVDMDPLIQTFRKVYAEDLVERIGLDRRKLPVALGVATLLNPMFGLKSNVVGSGLMTDDQYDAARNELICELQDIMDETAPPVYSDSSGDDSSEDEEDMPFTQNINYNKALAEVNAFDNYKKKKYRPSIVMSPKTQVLVGERKKIWVGCTGEAGKDLPSGKNLKNYIDKQTGRMDLLSFFDDHKRWFPTLWIVVQRNASRRVVEVGCERFFGLSGYISSPRRSLLGVRNYERLAMLACILRTVYIDLELVAKEYIQRCKVGAWKTENTEDALKCWNLERILDAESYGITLPAELTLDDLVNEERETTEQVIVIDED